MHEPLKFERPIKGLSGYLHHFSVFPATKKYIENNMIPKNAVLDIGISAAGEGAAFWFTKKQATELRDYLGQLIELHQER